MRREKLKSASLFDQRTAKRRSMMTSSVSSPVPYTEIQQEDKNLIHEAGSSDGAEKLDNKV